ncbi:MAG TPA: STAS domain-containing protein [Acidimicrobiales bacterium]|nr:STAS domain-containing protein [Acidimicrobiales bacterium]
MPPYDQDSCVHRTVDGDGVVLAVEGTLDDALGTVLLAAVSDAVASGTGRLDIDLSSIQSFDDAGTAALLACRDAASGVGGGLHYRTCGGGAGQEALLAAFAGEVPAESA